MAGMRLYNELKRMESTAFDLGFRLTVSHDGDSFSLRPLPLQYVSCHYDYSVFDGDHEEVIAFLRGIKFHQEYLDDINITDTEIRLAEKLYEQEKIVDVLKKDVE